MEESGWWRGIRDAGAVVLTQDRHLSLVSDADTRTEYCAMEDHMAAALSKD